MSLTGDSVVVYCIGCVLGSDGGAGDRHSAVRVGQCVPGGDVW